MMNVTNKYLRIPLVVISLFASTAIFAENYFTHHFSVGTSRADDSVTIGVRIPTHFEPATYSTSSRMAYKYMDPKTGVATVIEVERVSSSRYAAKGKQTAKAVSDDFIAFRKSTDKNTKIIDTKHEKISPSITFAHSTSLSSYDGFELAELNSIVCDSTDCYSVLYTAASRNSAKQEKLRNLVNLYEKSLHIIPQ
ncbi:MAG TPA: hypothetical protein VLG38_03130 [Gammaproteobacteria bacterium]|nr:hypothetical protein [Gammaproteobacteria bacterium]